MGDGDEGQLGLGDEANRLAPTIVGAQAAFGKLPVLTVVCGHCHSLVVTKDGALWTFGRESHGALGHNDCNTRLVPTHFEAQHFGNANIISVAGVSHSAAVTGQGTLYTWGEASGLGHMNREAKLVPMRIAPSLLQGACVGRCHDLPPIHALAFAMGTHSLLGSGAAPTAVATGGSSWMRPGSSGSKARRLLLLTRTRTVNMSRCQASWYSGW